MSDVVALCRSPNCQAEVVFIEHPVSGKRQIVDAGPYITVVTDTGEVVRGRLSHWATCKDRPRFEAARRQKA